MWNVFYNTDFPERQRFHQDAIDELSKNVNIVQDPKEADVVINIGSIHNKGILKGKVTVYLEGDCYLQLGRNKDFYDKADLLYIDTKHYLKYYPPKTQILIGIVVPEFHKELPIEKRYDFVYIGTLEPLPVYFNRFDFLNNLVRKTTSIYIGHGQPSEYPILMSMGKILLNVLPYDNITKNYGMNGKIFECMAMGCMMCDYSYILDEVCTKDVHYIPIQKPGEFSDARIDTIKRASRELVLSKYTVRHLVNNLLNDIDKLI